jgi:hypothetical protein
MSRWIARKIAAAMMSVDIGFPSGAVSTLPLPNVNVLN